MSIPKGTTSFFGRYDDPEKFRLIPQAGIRYDRNPAKLDYQYCWDMNVSPYTGKLYCAPCDESGRGLHARMVEYDWDKDESRVVIYPERFVLPRERHMPHTKFHESITFLPNGNLMATTHSTDRGKTQPEWMPFAHLDHIWDGFPGSYLFEYDPDTGKTISHGIPAPRESIYGMTYDAKYNALYMIGFMRGHVYRYSLDDHSVKDLGKAAEVFCYRLHAGPDGHIYGCTKSGYLWRVNVDTQELEDLNFRVPPQRYHYVLNTWYRYMARAVNVSDHEFIFATGSNYNFFLVDTNTLEVKPIGPIYDFDFTDDYLTNVFGINEIGIDAEGTIWFSAHTSGYAFCTDERLNDCDEAVYKLEN